MAKSMIYAETGVNYDAMDPFKRAAQKAAQTTAGNINRFGFLEVAESRGESAYLFETPNSYIAHVVEGLGTKNLVADAMAKLTGRCYYDQIAQDAVAMIVNDMITLGALPISVGMHLAVGEANWFDDEHRSSELIEGWRLACDLAACAWGGGETPTLRDIVMPGTVVLSGSGVGIISPKERRILGNLKDGDAIILIESSGIHANGATMARTIAEKLPEGYLTQLPDGRSYGETLLDPTDIYVDAVESCLDADIDIHYASNITGHGWRKLMRSPKPFSYVIDLLPTPKPIFAFMQEHGPVDDCEAYATLNMGAGFALYVAARDAERTVEIIEETGYTAFRAGTVHAAKERMVRIEPLDLTFTAETLAVR